MPATIRSAVKKTCPFSKGFDLHSERESAQSPVSSQKATSFSPPNTEPTLQAIEKRKDTYWNTDLSGQTGYKWDIPGLHATNFQSKNPYLNDFYRGINNLVGAGTGVVNYANNVAGSLLFDLPAKAEDFMVSKGWPNFEELYINAQMATPGMPLDDAIVYGLSKVSQVSKNVKILWELKTGRNDWAKLSGMLRDATKGAGNFGIGSATREQAEILGKAWVGEDYKISNNGKAFISSDGLRQYRPPSFKPQQGSYQANLQYRVPGQKEWSSNAHIDISE